MARAHNTNMIDMGLNYNTGRERNACIHKKIKFPAYTVKVLTKSRKLNRYVRAKCLTAVSVFTIIVNAKGICNTILIPNIKFIFAQKKGKNAISWCIYSCRKFHQTSNLQIYWLSLHDDGPPSHNWSHLINLFIKLVACKQHIINS